MVGLADGGFLVTWENDNANLVRAQRFDAVGDKIGAEFTVKSGVSVDSPDVALLQQWQNRICRRRCFDRRPRRDDFDLFD